MVDVFTETKRSEVMSRIRSKNTKLELSFRKTLWSKGFRYRIHSKNLPGKPDIVFATAKIAVFIDGCFWHGCPRCFHMPQSNREYWRRKIQYNTHRDKLNHKALRIGGWRVVRFWEHELKQSQDNCAEKVARILCEKSVPVDRAPEYV